MSTTVTRRAGAPSAWHWRTLLLAPHRLAFFLAMVVLAASSLWWALVQLDRAGAGLGFTYAVSPSLVHSAVMTFGFMPLFFAGFLFTAGPKWLGVEAPSARELAPALLLFTAGWLLWLVAAHVHSTLAITSLVMSLAGLLMLASRFWRLIEVSAAPDRIHAKAIGFALLVGNCSLGGLIIAMLADAPGPARGFVLTGLWGFVVLVFMSVAHRMIPFFTSSALPMVRAWRPFWVLGVLLAVSLFEVAGVWADTVFAGGLWPVLRGAVESLAALVVVWLVVAWGLVQSFKVRMLAMLHIGFLWLAVGLGLSGASHIGHALTGAAPLPLAGLHAITMGCLGSLMVAMVTRVSCGHSGRPLVADNLMWTLFWMLQAATLLRIAAAGGHAFTAVLTAFAALVWAVMMCSWGLRYGAWYGRARADGRPG